MESSTSNGVQPFVFDGARVDAVDRDIEEWPDEDAFGNTGRTTIEVDTAVALCPESGDRVAGWYSEAGFTRLPGDANREDERLRLQRILTDASNPFLLEHVVQVGVAWRELMGAQRDVLDRKLTALRAELDGKKTSKRRRLKATRMIEELEAGMLTTVRVESTRRLFHIDPMLDENGCLGRLLPLQRFDQVLYTVRSMGPEEEEEDSEPMFLTVLGTDGYSVAFLYSGGILGQRIINDLDEGVAHHAWFRNRQCDRTDDTAPWISRRIYREITQGGESGLVIRWERDREPVSLRKVGEDTLEVVTPEGPAEVPVLVVESEKDDRLWVLDDEESPLVLRMEEAGANLLRTIDEVRRLAL